MHPVKNLIIEIICRLSKEVLFGPFLCGLEYMATVSSLESVEDKSFPLIMEEVIDNDTCD